MRRIVFLLSICSMILSDNLNSNYIIMKKDAIGHYNLYLNTINPYRQSMFSIGAIKINPGTNNQPMACIVPNLNFIGNADSAKIVSQFTYNRGDYAYRETDVLVKNLVTDKGTLLFNLHGRKNPVYYESEISNIDGYVLQNFLVDYTHQISDNEKEGFFRVSKHYHKKKLEAKTVEINSVGVDYNINSLLHSFVFNYSNNFYGIEESDGLLDSQFDSARLSYLYKKWRSIMPFIRLNYNKYLLHTHYSFYDIQLGFDFNYASSEKFKQKIEVGYKIDYLSEGKELGAFIFDYMATFQRVKFQLKQYKNNHIYSNGGHGFDESSALFITAPTLYKEDYLLKSMEWSKNDFSMRLLHYDVTLDIDVSDIEAGVLSGLEIDYNKDKIDFVLPSNDYRDALEFSLKYLDYNYSNIDYYATLNFGFTFNNLIESLFRINIDKYVSYSKASYSSMKYNSNNEEYGLVDFEVGLIFEDFNISYQFINNEIVEYQISGVSTPPYPMKYLNIIWKFDN